MFDNIGFAYLNSSSIILKVSSNDTSLAKIRMSEPNFNNAVKSQKYN